MWPQETTKVAKHISFEGARALLSTSGALPIAYLGSCCCVLLKQACVHIEQILGKSLTKSLEALGMLIRLTAGGPIFTG